MDIGAGQSQDRVGSQRAFELTAAALEYHGNTLSAAHRQALVQAVRLFTDVASGNLRGRYVLDLPAGLGKTTAIIEWAKALVEVGADWTLAICATRVEEL